MHSAYHTEWDPWAVLPEALLQFSLGLRVGSHSRPLTPDSEYHLSSDIRSQGAICPTIFDSVLITAPGENSASPLKGVRGKTELQRGLARAAEPDD